MRMRRTVDVPLSDGEIMLVQAEVLHLHGPLGFRGVLSLTSARLVFTPTSRLDRLVGADDLEIDLDDVEKASFGGLNSFLSVVVSGEDTTFGGKGARLVFERLEPILLNEEGEFTANERVLIHGEVDVYLKGNLATKCELRLTDHRFRLKGSGGLESLIFSSIDVLEDLSALHHVGLVGIQQRLSVAIGDEELTLGGRLVPELYAKLSAFVADDAEEEDADDTSTTGAVLESWTGTNHRGPLAVQGLFVASTQCLSFSPTGALDSLVGVEATELPLGSLARLAVRGWPERRLVLSTQDREHIFGMSEPLERFSSLADLMLRMDVAPPFADGRTGGEVDEESAIAWCAEHGFELGGKAEHVRFVEWGLMWVDDTIVRPGWLVLTTHRVGFVALGEAKKGDPPTAFDIPHVLRLDPDGALPDHVRFQVEDMVVRFSLRGELDSVVEFWARCEAPMGEADSGEFRGGQPLSKIMGQAHFLEVMLGEDKLHEARPGWVSPHDEGLSIFLPHELVKDMASGTRLQLRVGRDEGLYQFDGFLVGMEAPATTRGRSLVIFQRPPNVRYWNRRSGFRVDLGAVVKAEVLVHAEATGWTPRGKQLIRVEDMSSGGCAVRSAKEVSLGERLHFCLELGPGVLEFTAECVHIGPAEGGDGHALLGLVFVGLDGKNRAGLNREVLRLEREQLKKRYNAGV